MKIFVYGLIDPRTNEVRYIGKTLKGMSRPRSHGKASVLQTVKTHRTNWIKGLVAEGLTFGIVVLEFCTRENVAQRERDWIAWGRHLGWRLTNHTDGGDGVPGLRLSDEHKKQIGERHRGKTVSAESRAKIAKSVGRPVTDITTGITYESAAQAARILGIGTCGIYRCLEGKQIQTGGHSFIPANMAFFSA